MRKGMIDIFSLFSISLMFGLIYLLRTILLYPRLLLPVKCRLLYFCAMFWSHDGMIYIMSRT
jgi:hypothetical protein